MIYNILLAMIPVFLGWLQYLIKTKSLKFIFFIAWLIFVPNTIYLFTDVKHLIKDLYFLNSLALSMIIILQYMALLFAGFLTYILSLYPIEKMLTKKYKKSREINVTTLIIGINFIIGIGVVLGRIYRLNTWDMIVNVKTVASAIIEIMSTPALLTITILLGLFANFLYFLFKKNTIKYILKKI